MIIKAPIKQGTVVTVRFLNGEEVIGRYEGETASTITLGKPAVLVQRADSIGMSGFLLTAFPDSIAIFKSSLLIEPVTTNSEIASKYTEQTTGIIT
jgi:hypothetical protein